MATGGWSTDKGTLLENINSFEENVERRKSFHWSPQPSVAKRLNTSLAQIPSNLSSGPLIRNSAYSSDESFLEDYDMVPMSELKTYPPETPPEGIKDVSKLSKLTPENILHILEKRYEQDLIYTCCSEVLISINPNKDLGIYGKEHHDQYIPGSLSDKPHLFMVSAKAYSNVQMKSENQVILVSGESGAGKTEATKFMVEHLMSLGRGGAGTDGLHDKIIKVNILLEAFGNAKTVLNSNSSRFAKYLRLNYNENGQIQSADIKDYMLEKSRVVHQEEGETNFHCFYSLLMATNKQSLLIDDGHIFRITGNFSPTSQMRQKYQKIYKNQQEVFSLLGMEKEEITDVNTILAAILHIGDIEFEESDNDSVIIKNEDVVQKVAKLLDLDPEQFVCAIIQKRGKIDRDATTITEIATSLSQKINTKWKQMPKRKHKWAKGEIQDDEDNIDLTETEYIEFSKNKTQAQDERDALAKTLYERMFGWLVWKINKSLRTDTSSSKTIGILDVCGFEDLGTNGFEQLCINVVNEQIQNFMNRKVIEEEKWLFEGEGLQVVDVDTTLINNDLVLSMFRQKQGILDSIDEDSKHEISADDNKMVRKLNAKFGTHSRYIATKTNRPEFTIRHFAAEVKYNATGFMMKNRDTMGDLMVKCMKKSGNPLVHNLFDVERSHTGSISMAKYTFQRSKKVGHSKYKQSEDHLGLSALINKSCKKVFDERFKGKKPKIQTVDLSKKQTHIHFFKNSLDELVTVLEKANPFFVRCLKPNDDETPGTFMKDRVMVQLRYNGICEIAQILSVGLPDRLTKVEFLDSYRELAEHSNSSQTECQDVFDGVQARQENYKIGNQQVFMTNQVHNLLDDELLKLRQKQEEIRRRERAIEQEQKEIEEKLQESQEKLNTFTAIPKTIASLRNGDVPIENKFSAQRSKNSLAGTIHYEGGRTSSQNISLYERLEYTSGTATTQNLKDLTRAQESHIDIDTPSDDVEDNIDEKTWDTFKEVTEEEERLDIVKVPSLKAVKVLVYVLLFLVLLTCLVTQKVSFITLIRGTQAATVPALQTVSYVMLMIVMIIPHGFTMIVSGSKLIFGINRRPSLWTFIWSLTMELLHTIGLCLLVFRVLVRLDSVRIALLLNATVFLPCLLKLSMADSWHVVYQRPKPSFSFRLLSFLLGLLDFLAMGVQLLMVFAIIWWNYVQTDQNPWRMVELGGALVLSSFGHWENFVDGRILCAATADTSWFRSAVLKMRWELQEGRQFVSFLASGLKITAIVLVSSLLRGVEELDYEKAFNYLSWCGESLMTVTAIIACTISALVAFFFGLGACKLNMQRFSFALPLLLSTPVTIGVLLLDCHYNFLAQVSARCRGRVGRGRLTDTEPVQLLDCPQVAGDSWYFLLFGSLCWLSLMLISRHVWWRQDHLVATTERLFIKSGYCGILTAEDLILNRRRNQRKITFESVPVDKERDTYLTRYKFMSQTKTEDEQGEGSSQESQTRTRVTPKLYACATMWHETRTEMVQILKSIHRLDMNQYLRWFSNGKSNEYDPKFYEFEAHIFFDDAMELDDDNNHVPNRYVKDLVLSMTEACSSVHGKPINVHEPLKMPTPYGGQLIWQMPGANLLFVHLKNVSRIRNRKRWSQVMYMYYLLSYKLIGISKEESIQRERGKDGLSQEALEAKLKQEIEAKMNSTYLLALDGDTDFNPVSVHLLMDRMQNDVVGAVCGRIHPVGTGPMVMYQKFEYAIGHWLQKAAEHVFGCVLCSPGCFSLFRAGALVDNNVLRRYTTEATEPSHFLQYDQGEDRWLCTLLLQRGYRIEYVAGADAWTFAPEGFYEFFKQRRRWMPSTLANILELLNTSERTRKINRNISLLYILYQWFLMLMTILGPGTILMMIAGATQLVLKISLINSYLLALIPAAVYMLACFWCSQNFQLAMAAVMSLVYAFSMMVVLVGTIITATTENPLHPSVVVMALLMFIFIFTAVCHPLEMGSLLHAFLYLLLVPSGYLLLVIYSIVNLNDVSWGTREVPTKAQLLEAERKKKEEEEKKASKKHKGFFAKIFDRGEHIVEVTNLLKAALPRSQPRDTSNSKDLVAILVQIEQNTRRLLQRQPEVNPATTVVSQPIAGQEEYSTLPPPPSSSRSQQPSTPRERCVMDDPVDSGNSLSDEYQSLASIAAPTTTQPAQPDKPKRTTKISKTAKDWQDPIWAKDEGLGHGKTIQGSKMEMDFWREFVNEYLLPIYPSDDEKKKTAEGLRTLRNSAVLGLTIVNSLWIAFNFMFQYTEAAAITIIYQIGDQHYEFKESVLGLSFVIVLLTLLILQMIGMLMHRFGTLQHLLAAVPLFTSKKGNDKDITIDRSDDRMRKIYKAIRVPIPNDDGMATEPPDLVDPSQPNQNIGLSVVPRRSNKYTLKEDLGKSVIRLGAELARPDNQDFLDVLSEQANDITQLGKISTHSITPINAGLGVTYTNADLRRLNLAPSERIVRRRRETRGMCAMDRSLFQRGQLFEEAKRQQQQQLRQEKQSQDHESGLNGASSSLAVFDIDDSNVGKTQRL